MPHHQSHYADNNEETNRAPLLKDTVDGVVDHKGCPVRRSNSGGWRSAGFIIGVEVAERFAYYGIEANLISYLTGPLGQSVASAAANVNTWDGVALLLPLVGAFVADSFLGRYRSVILASLLYVLGLGSLTVSAVISATEFQVVLFFFSLYLIAIAQSIHKPCVQAFGADQFDANDPKENKARSSFFNWWYFGVCGGVFVTTLVLSYVQDYISWALGFGIPCVVMVVALVVFLLGTKTFRYSVKLEQKSAYARIVGVFMAAFRNRALTSGAVERKLESRGILPRQSFEQFKFLNKASLALNGSNEDGMSACSAVEVEEAKSVLRLIPVWVSCLAFGTILALVPTFLTKQGSTMERTIVPGFEIPPAALQCFSTVAVLLFLPLYEWVFVPFMRAFTGQPSGITMLQRIGSGMVLSIISTTVAALVETKRLGMAQEYDLIDKPGAKVPMSVWWLLPQYVLSGITDVLTVVGLQEFFYDQVPIELRSIGLALYLSIFGLGNLLSSLLISIIEGVTGGDGRSSWFSNNLNRGHLDYYYWLLTGLSVAALALFLCVARLYNYNRKGLA